MTIDINDRDILAGDVTPPHHPSINWQGWARVHRDVFIEQKARVFSPAPCKYLREQHIFQTIEGATTKRYCNLSCHGSEFTTKAFCLMNKNLALNTTTERLKQSSILLIASLVFFKKRFLPAFQELFSISSFL